MNSPIYLSPPHVISPKERHYLLEAFDSNWIAPLGPHLDAFEKELAAKVGAEHAVGLSSGTAAIHLGLKLLGVGDGDEVLCSTLTFSASVNPVRYLNATPVFIDSERRTWNMDPDLLAKELHERALKNRLPKAVVVVDLYGQCADYDPIVEICDRYEIPILEDAAEALGASCHGKQAGVFGKVGVFSFNGNKIITTSGGGMLVTDNPDWADKARFWATQSRDPAPHYQHSEIGFNYRLSNLCAAVGRGQLETLDERIRLRRSHCEYYRRRLDGLPGIEFMPEPKGFFSNRWLTCLTVDPKHFGATREDVRLALQAEKIESRPVWKPMHLQPFFSDGAVRGGQVAESLFENGLCLPSGSGMSAEEMERVVMTIRDVYRHAERRHRVRVA